MWNGSLWVGTAVGIRPMWVVRGAMNEAIERGLQPAPHLIGPVVGPAPAGGLHPEAVLDGEGVEQAPLGRAGEVGPVAGGEQLRRPGRRVAPRRRVPAGAVQGRHQMQVSHMEQSLSMR